MCTLILHRITNYLRWLLPRSSYVLEFGQARIRLKLYFSSLNGTRLHMVYLTGHSLLSKCCGIARYTRTGKFNVIFAHKKSPSFPAPIFIRMTTARQNCGQISCAESHPIRTVHMESTDRSLFAISSNVRHSLHRFSRNQKNHSLHFLW